MLDFIVEPVVLSKRTGKPIKVVWSREDDMRGWNYRPYSLHALEAGLDSNGKLVGIEHRVAVQSCSRSSRPSCTTSSPTACPAS